MSYTSWQIEESLKEAFNAPTVAAGAGYFRLDGRYPEREPEPILAWRVGQAVVLPVTRFGTECEECWVMYPDGGVRLHHVPAYSEVPEFKSKPDWLEFVRRPAESKPQDALPF